MRQPVTMLPAGDDFAEAGPDRTARGLRQPTDADQWHANQRIMEALNDPIAQELIWSPIPARVAYTALDGTPRVVPHGSSLERA